MRAAVCEGNRTIVVREVPTPEPGPGQVLVRVKYCAICGSDVHDYLYDLVRPGTVLGHEFSPAPSPHSGLE
jgi:threonine dehydrogenase-like Zn-dependent dehydrogenase